MIPMVGREGTMRGCLSAWADTVLTLGQLVLSWSPVWPSLARHLDLSTPSVSGAPQYYRDPPVEHSQTPTADHVRSDNIVTEDLGGSGEL